MEQKFYVGNTTSDWDGGNTEMVKNIMQSVKYSFEISYKYYKI